MKTENPSSLDVLSKFTGIDKSEIKTIIQQIKENRERLSGCKRHNFTELPDQKTLNKKYQCANCKGEINALEKYWYDIGVKDGKNE